MFNVAAKCCLVRNWLTAALSAHMNERIHPAALLDGSTVNYARVLTLMLGWVSGCSTQRHSLHCSRASAALPRLCYPQIRSLAARPTLGTVQPSSTKQLWRTLWIWGCWAQQSSSSLRLHRRLLPALCKQLHLSWPRSGVHRSCVTFDGNRGYQVVTRWLPGGYQVAFTDF